MRIDIVTLFPELCDGFLSTSILGRARAKNLFEAHCHQIRDYTKNKQRQTDDYPYGGGCGMVLYAQPIADCLRAVADQCAQQGRAKPHVVFLTAAGQPYNEETARRLSSYESLDLSSWRAKPKRYAVWKSSPRPSTMPERMQREIILKMPSFSWAKQRKSCPNSIKRHPQKHLPMKCSIRMSLSWIHPEKAVTMPA